MTRSTKEAPVDIIDPTKSEGPIPDGDRDGKLDLPELHKVLHENHQMGRSGIGRLLLYDATGLAVKETGQLPTDENLAEYLGKALNAAKTSDNPYLRDVAQTFSGIDLDQRNADMNKADAAAVLSYLTSPNTPAPYSDGRSSPMEKG